MRLKKLEISGFKSFAHKAALEFPVTISAVVGPNGSGKSNIVDALRWVLGEQSMKHLRSKSGVDLIWAGSPKKPAVGKASVSLYFNNKDGFFPIDFEEVVIGRKVYRDGVNEYFLNESPVRLKDIAELLARSKLGLRGHSIVNQGAADEVLKSNPDERRSILEEALGLREFQLKKGEAEAKLTETGQNLDQTVILINEISPHLRSLKRQVEKWQKREFLIKELDVLETDFFKFKISEILKERGQNRQAKEAIDVKVAASSRDLEELEKKFENRMKEVSQTGQKTEEIEEVSQKLNSGRHEIMRELGRIEGLIESARRNNSKNIKTLEAVLAIKTKYWGKRLNAIAEITDAAAARESVRTLASEIQTIANHFERNEIDRILALVDLADFTTNAETPYEEEKNQLKIKLNKIESELRQAQEAIAKIRGEEGSFRENYLNMQKELELARRQYVLAQEESRKFDFEEEKIKLREADVKAELWGSGKNYDEFIKFHFGEDGGARVVAAGAVNIAASIVNVAELQNKIIRLRRDIADIGALDREIMREYEETNKRHEFLTTEFNDLSGAVGSLKNLIGDLTKRINDDFKTGLVKISDEFNHYFRLMFGGGSARLVFEAIEGQEQPGVSISANIPQKRIRDLTMLSGGERALTSIALLFAIVAASHPPFLVLDEIDAALDENNAVRFAKVLNDLAQKTQFILITHNRATMEAAEVLYGVTMGDDGVSKLFSLKLTDADVGEVPGKSKI